MEKRYYPETSRDANGSTGFIGLRYSLMWLVLLPTLYSAKTQQVEDKWILFNFRDRSLSFVVEDFFYLI